MPSSKKRHRKNFAQTKKKRAKKIIDMSRFNWPFLMLSIAFTFGCFVEYGAQFTQEHDGVITLNHKKVSQGNIIPLPTAAEISYDTGIAIIRECSNFMDMSSYTPFIASHLLAKSEAGATQVPSDYRIVAERCLKHLSTSSIFGLHYLGQSVDNNGRWTIPSLALKAYDLFSYFSIRVLVYTKDAWFTMWNIESVSSDRKARKPLMTFSTFNTKNLFQTFSFAILSILLCCFVSAGYDIIDILIETDVPGLDEHVDNVMNAINSRKQRATRADGDRVESSLAASESTMLTMHTLNKAVSSDIALKIKNPTSVTNMTAQFSKFEVETCEDPLNDPEVFLDKVMIDIFQTKEDEKKILNENAHYMYIKS